ncbi:23S rRNA (pseudouridine(1915)-N(3))-methyltransferase RlmH [Patescibacteria group bacterium]|nr:MAG: 23S rRNA (pseudouridine(1915)-N(3))-methyltransferase RlmH [Patescibacteria group bacterium]
MYRFQLTSVGDMRNEALQELRDLYVARLHPFAKVDREVVRATPFRSEADRPKCRAEETGRLRASLKEGAFTVLLTEGGKLFDTKGFASWMDKTAESGARPIQFLVAGTLGTEAELAKEVDMTLSLSPLTFPHELALVVLLEQLYRVCTVVTGKTYHY